MKFNHEEISLASGVDGLAGGGGGGVAKRLLANGMDIGVLCPWQEKDPRGNLRGFMTVNGVTREINVNATTLRKEEWLMFDTTVTQVLRQDLVGVADLNARGLTMDLANGLGTTVLEWESISDMAPAEMNMSGRTRGRSDRPEWTPAYLPLPIVHGEFDIDIRQLNSSRRLGQPLDTTAAMIKGRKIADFLEDLLFNGVSGHFPFGGGHIYGYKTHPNRITGSLTGNWDESAQEAVEIVEDVMNMVQAARAKYFRGPFALYVPTNYAGVLNEDYHSGASGWHSGQTIRQRILEIPEIGSVRVADALTDDNVVLVQMTVDVVRMVNGLPVRTVEWDEEGGMVTHFKIMTIQIPHIRDMLVQEQDNDTNRYAGIVHYS